MSNTSRTPLFQQKYGESLLQYASALAGGDEDIVVTVSRKTPRLIDFINSIYPETPIATDNHVSEKALPFIHHDVLAASTVSITDDSLIFGSTFSELVEPLEAQAKSVSRLVLARSLEASHFVAERTESILDLTSREMREFIDLEIRAFGTLSKPYDIDHPIFSTRVEDVEAFVSHLRDIRVPVAETTRLWQREHGIRSFTVEVGRRVRASHPLAGSQYGPVKVRIFVDTRRGVASLVGIHSLALTVHDLADSTLFNRHGVNYEAAWDALLNATLSSAMPLQERNRSLMYGAHYLASAMLVRIWDQYFELGLPLEVSSRDVRLLFGPLESVVSAAVASPPESGQISYATAMPRRVHLDADREIAAISESARGTVLFEQLGQSLHFADMDSPSDQLTSFFRAQRKTFDLATRASEYPKPGRLDTGVPFAVVPSILSLWHAEVDSADFERWCDFAIDGGSIVPRYAQSQSEPSIWVRTVRFGERGEENLRYWLHGAVEAAQEAFAEEHSPKPNPDDDAVRAPNPIGVPWLVAEKALVVVYNALGKDLVSTIDVDVSRGFDKYGARLKYRPPADDAETFLLDWGVRWQTIAKTTQQVAYKRRNDAQGTSSFVRAAVDFDGEYPPDDNQLDRQFMFVTGEIVRAFIAVEAELEGDQRKLAMLALSTCNTSDGYLTALSKELYLWSEGNKYSAIRLLGQLKWLSNQSVNGSGVAELEKTFQQSSAILEEIQVKRSAFEKREAIVQRIDELTEPSAKLGSSAQAWKVFIRPTVSLTPLSANMVSNEEYLLLAASIADKATAVARTLLSEARVTRDTRKRSKKTSLDEQVAEYNEVILRARASGVVSKLPDLVTIKSVEVAPLSAASAAGVAWNVIFEAQRAVRSIINRWRFPRDRDDFETATSDWTVLKWDIRGSSGFQDRRALNQAIVEVKRVVADFIASVHGRGDPSNLDDSGTYLLGSVRDALALAQLVSEQFARSGLKVRMGVESTFGQARLERHVVNQTYSGSALIIAERLKNAYEEAGRPDQAEARFLEASGQPKEAIPPEASYLLISEHTLKVLEQSENARVPVVFSLFSSVERLNMRSSSALPTRAYCYSFGPS